MSNLIHKYFSRPLLIGALIAGLAACGGNSSGISTTTSSIQSSGTSQSSGSTDTSTPVIQPDQNASFSLQWTAPVSRTDGSPISLSDINGYRVYYGNARGYYPNRINITSGSATSAIIENLAPGTYFVVMTTYDNTGLESRYSVEVTKTAI
ncbi:MAG: fibronectin type III domain-containing protein [Thiohalobacterales bacterium]|nr:fibronectin type III domain-containing protein [Thiohalobacterales bacterium]